MSELGVRILTHLAKIEEIGDQSPDLILLNNKSGIQVQVIRGNDLQNIINNQV